MMGALQAIEPVVLGIAFPKCATTWLHRQLEAHPEIACTTKKETGYWTINFDHGPDWYVRQFPIDKKTKIYAEFDPNNYKRQALLRICNDLPNAKFLISIRNPYERCFSKYFMMVRHGFKGSFKEAIIQNSDIVDGSLYATHIKKYLNYFDMDRLHIILFDEIKENNLNVIKTTYNFIGVDSNFIPMNLDKKIRQARSYSTLGFALRIIEVFTTERLGLKRSHLKKLRLWRHLEMVFAWLAKRYPPPAINSADLRILDNHLLPEILETQEIIGRNLSHWLI